MAIKPYLAKGHPVGLSHYSFLQASTSASFWQNPRTTYFLPLQAVFLPLPDFPLEPPQLPANFLLPDASIRLLWMQTGFNGTHHSHQTNFVRNPLSSAQEIPLGVARARQSCVLDGRRCPAYPLVLQWCGTNFRSQAGPGSTRYYQCWSSPCTLIRTITPTLQISTFSSQEMLKITSGARYWNGWILAMVLYFPNYASLKSQSTSRP
jgi:hypothetical protein